MVRVPFFLQWRSTQQALNDHNACRSLSEPLLYGGLGQGIPACAISATSKRPFTRDADRI